MIDCRWLLHLAGMLAVVGLLGAAWLLGIEMGWLQ
jgi:hypothetical protein